MKRYVLLITSIIFMETTAFSMIEDQKGTGEPLKSPFNRSLPPQVDSSNQLEKEKQQEEQVIREKLNKILEENPDLRGCPFSYDKKTGNFKFAV